MSVALVDSFRDPPATWRSIPFWSLNDRLDPAEIARQLAEFARGGFGGAYLHSRIGLLTPYLGEEWWQAMDAGVAACERLGIEAWFYDEDAWPSGYAGGIVPRQDPQFRHRWLERLPAHTASVPGDLVLAEDAQWRYVCRTAAMGEARFNGTCWVDLLNPATVQAFIDCTYRPYLERYAGRRVRGIFTDEPQVSPRAGPGAVAVPFSPILLADVRERVGYDLTSRFAELFAQDGSGARVRLDYFRSLAWRLEQSFSIPVGRVCADAGLTWTGHYNGEQTFMTVLTNVGNLMIQYRHMQQPGIDHLGLSFGQLHDVHAMRSLSSVANQYGQERRLSELFGISGQNMDFEDRAWIAEGHAVLGINHFCPHLSLYSLKGCRKRDYPPTLSPQQPWWGWNRLLEDRLARTALMSSQGAYGAELLVIHPLESAYVELINGGHGPQSAVQARFAQFTALLGSLQDHHRDYDLGDEQILADIGVVEGRRLRVGRMSYDALVLPPMATIRPSTIALIEAFARAGGAVFAVTSLPSLVDGEPAPAGLERLRGCATVVPMEVLITALAKAVPPAVTIAGAGADQVWIHRRLIDGAPLVMLFNRSRRAAVSVEVAITGLTDPVCWDPATATCTPVDLSGAVELAPAQTIFVGDGKCCPPGQRAAYAPKPGPVVARIPVTGPWRLQRLDPNALTLDFASASLDDGATWGPTEPVLGLYQRFTRDRWSGRLQLRFAIAVEQVPARADLVIEQPEMYRRISVNGHTVQADQKRFFKDRSMPCVDVDGRLRDGVNTVELELDFIAPDPANASAVERYGSEIESIYLVGDFAVAATVSPEPPAPLQRNADPFLVPQRIHRLRGFRIVGEPATVGNDLVREGYPFFAGAVALSTSIDLRDHRGGARYLLLLHADAIVVQPRVNGEELPALAWSPWQADITAHLHPGINELTLTIVNSLRNLLGPHHHRDGELTKVGPDSFTGRTTWTGGGPGDADWYDVRLVREPRIWRDDYHVIPFGCSAEIVVC